MSESAPSRNKPCHDVDMEILLVLQTSLDTKGGLFRQKSEELVNLHGEDLKQYISSLKGLDESTKNDIYQSTFEGFFKAVETIDASKGTISAYLRGIAYNRFIDETRDRKKARSPSETSSMEEVSSLEQRRRSKRTRTSHAGRSRKPVNTLFVIPSFLKPSAPVPYQMRTWDDLASGNHRDLKGNFDVLILYPPHFSSGSPGLGPPLIESLMDFAGKRAVVVVLVPGRGYRIPEDGCDQRIFRDWDKGEWILYSFSQVTQLLTGLLGTEGTPYLSPQILPVHPCTEDEDAHQYLERQIQCWDPKLDQPPFLNAPVIETYARTSDKKVVAGRIQIGRTWLVFLPINEAKLEDLDIDSLRQFSERVHKEVRCVPLNAFLNEAGACEGNFFRPTDDESSDAPIFQLEPAQCRMLGHLLAEVEKTGSAMIPGKRIAQFLQPDLQEKHLHPIVHRINSRFKNYLRSIEKEPYKLLIREGQTVGLKFPVDLQFPRRSHAKPTAPPSIDRADQHDKVEQSFS